MSKKLTLKQKKFADEYIISGNIYQSAIKAGYSDNYAKGNAKKLFENMRVKAYIDKRLEKIASEKIADADEILQYLTSVLRGESQAEVVTTVGTGNGKSKIIKAQKAPDEKERLKAAELIGKRYGIYTDKIDINADMEIKIDVSYED